MNFNNIDKEKKIINGFLDYIYANLRDIIRVSNKNSFLGNYFYEYKDYKINITIEDK